MIADIIAFAVVGIVVVAAIAGLLAAIFFCEGGKIVGLVLLFFILFGWSLWRVLRKVFPFPEPPDLDWNRDV